MTFPTLCPRCQQGPDLHRVRVPEIDRVLFICHECDATFASETDIAQNRFADLSQYLSRFGLTPMTITEEATNVA
jgi:transposase-like protein